MVGERGGDPLQPAGASTLLPPVVCESSHVLLVPGGDGEVVPGDQPCQVFEGGAPDGWCCVGQPVC